jgi:PTH1 family peptidyl-tRNA hydrolase
LKSLIEQLGTQEFPRMRVGVGRGDARRDLADHVLATFDRDERTIVGEAVARAVDAVEVFIADGIGPMMNRFNRKNDVAEEDAKE